MLSRRLALGAAIAMPWIGRGRAETAAPPQIRFILPYSTGGTADLVARMVGDRMGAALNSIVVPDYRPGANLIIAAKAAAEALPDGRTIFMGTGTSQSLNVLLRSKLPYRPDQFAPISMLTQNDYALVVPNDSPAKTLAELVALARERPGHLNAGSYGAGNITHLAMELFASMAGITVQNVPYRDGPRSHLDLMAGRLDLMIAQLAVLPQIREGQMRALGVTSPRRHTLLPDVPTIAEQGYPGYDVRGWFAMFAPAGTPAALLSLYNAEVNRALADPAMMAAFLPQGLLPSGSTPAALDAQIAAENALWAPIIERLGLRDNV